MKTLSINKKSNRIAAFYILLLFCVMAAMFMLRKCSQPPAGIVTVTAKSQGDTIDVAIDYSPVSMYVRSDSLSGFNYDLMRTIAGRGNLPVKFHPVVSLDQALRGLDAGVFDVVISDLPATLDFQGRYRLTQPLYLDRQVLLQHRDSLGLIDDPVESVLDLAGRHVWVVANSPMQSRIQSLSAEIGDTIYVESDPEYSAELLYLLTSIGEIHLCVVNEQVARAMAADKKNGRDNTVNISTGVSFTQHQSWALHNDNEALAAKIDSLILDFKSTDEYVRLCKKYLR